MATGGDDRGFTHWSERDPSQRVTLTAGFVDGLIAELVEIRWHLGRIDRTLTQILNREKHMDTELTTLTNAVEAEGSVVDSAIVLLEQLVADIEAEKNDPVAIQAIVDSVNAQKQKLTEAIVANTPAAPPANDGTGADNPNIGDGAPPAGAGDTSTQGDTPIAGDAPQTLPDDGGVAPTIDPDVPDTAAVNPEGSDTFDPNREQVGDATTNPPTDTSGVAGGMTTTETSGLA